eukprot:CAMPEP_0178910656 /NCGR_PEP_ID=MMETSP0786-20121207/9218_1 /TAXON_ID=186022 /ORGANISM="Thalassionema frauenfeldii, Strain CCMP 1798" /LENGTH=664 /DNA_ID=CAMNT_0020582931 /DNA_START=125 /DNA_END=2115 /DNA_ORIENTATION=+
MLLEEEFIQKKQYDNSLMVAEDDATTSSVSSPGDAQQSSLASQSKVKDDEDDSNLMLPLMMNPNEEFDSSSVIRKIRRSRNNKNRHQRKDSPADNNTISPNRSSSYTRRNLAVAPTKKYTVIMMMLARLLFWTSVCATVAAVIWYSNELKNNGTNPHLIAFFSAGAFVLLGFPISIYGIVMHLANYNQPNIQVYIIRILWMVPIYSMESWLCLRYHEYAIYIETLRDFYESYVLYSFLQFLIQVLGGEEELILLLKDKSPTRGVHMWGLQYCMRPWLMGVPVSRSVVAVQKQQKLLSATVASADDNHHHPYDLTPSSSSDPHQQHNNLKRPHKQVKWTSPFFVQCKLGVLQYVLLKFILSIVTMILELQGLYKEGNFTPKGGYLYICILTNLSQCWALYCLIFFYFATVTELSPIRPVGKFLSVKAIVFFTWWQSVCISLIYQANLIPHYQVGGASGDTADGDSYDWTPEDIAKGLQDYLICIEMFVASLVHVFVFPHTDYLPQAVQARQQNQIHYYSHGNRRVGRLVSPYGWLYTSDDTRSKNSKNSGTLELASTVSGDPTNHATNKNEEQASLLMGDANATTTTANSIEEDPLLLVEDNSTPDAAVDAQQAQQQEAPGFISALLDSTINTALPRDIFQNSAGIIKGDYNVEKKTLLQHATTS